MSETDKKLGGKAVYDMHMIAFDLIILGSFGALFSKFGHN